MQKISKEEFINIMEDTSDKALEFCSESLTSIAHSLDDIIELRARIEAGHTPSEEEITFKLTRMAVGMSEIVEIAKSIDK